jgi:endoglucanase
MRPASPKFLVRHPTHRVLRIASLVVTLAVSGPLLPAQLPPWPQMDFDRGDKAAWPTNWARSHATAVRAADADGNSFLRIGPAGEAAATWRMLELPDTAEAIDWTGQMRGHAAPGRAWMRAEFLATKDAPPLAEMKQAIPELEDAVWRTHTFLFEVPPGARFLRLGPVLAPDAGGHLDLDHVRIRQARRGEARAAARSQPKPVTPSVEAPQRERWPAELKVTGPDLTTAAGEKVWLQGLHIVSLEWNPAGEHVLRSARVALDDWKSNVLRLSVREDYWAGRTPEQQDGGAAYRALIDAVITLTSNRGAYVVLDLHRYRAIREEHLAFWREVAGVYGNHPAVLFDLINEPHSISWPVWRDGGDVAERKRPADEDAFLAPEQRRRAAESFRSPGMQAAVDAIRAAGARNVIVAGGLDWAYDLTGIIAGYALNDPRGNGIMYAAHIYPWKSDWAGKVLAAARHHPVLVGEVGCDTLRMPFVAPYQHEDPYAWAPEVIGFIQEHRLHWTAFSFHPRATPILIENWNYEPTPFWGAFVKAALAGERFRAQRWR